MSTPDGTTTRTTSSAGKWLRRVASFATASTSMVLAGAAVWIGVSTIEMRADEKPPRDPAPLAVVETVRPEPASSYLVTRRYVGRLEPSRQTDLAFEFGGTVARVLVDEGEIVEAGGLVAALDTRTLQAERRQQAANHAALQSDLELARLTFERRQSLAQNGHISAQSLDEIRLQVARLQSSVLATDAAIEAIDVRLDKALLRAPFSGRISVRAIDEGATVGAGSPVLTILETARPRVRIGLTPEQADLLSDEDAHPIKIRDREFPARLLARRPDLQTRTRTVEALFELDNSAAAAAFGQLAELEVRVSVDDAGFWVPVSALKEGQRGLWALFSLSPAEDGSDGVMTVQQESVEILHVSGDRAYVRGTLASDAILVASGVHKVVPGKTVRRAPAKG